MLEEIVRHHQANISGILHLNNIDGTEDDIIWEEEAANDGDSDRDLIYPDQSGTTPIRTRSYVPSSMRKALMRISCLAEKFHQTQMALV